MTLIENMKLLMPLSPNPPDDGMKVISDALELAITLHIRTTLIPGLGATFLAAAPQNPFTISLALHLDATVSPIISTAASTQATLGGPLQAWLSVQPTFDSLSLAVPPLMAGGFGALFWQAIILTIRLGLPPPPDGTDSDGDGRTEVLEIEE